MASNSPEYPKVQDYQLRCENGKVYGPAHPIDGGNYAPLDTASGYDGEFSSEVVRRWNAFPELLEALEVLSAYANGRLGKNPYCIPEYEAALKAIGKARRLAIDGNKWMDANNEAYTAMRKANGE